MFPSVVAWALVVLAALAGSIMATRQAAGQEPISIDALVARLTGADEKDPYHLTAEFSGTLTLTVKSTRLSATAAGVMEEWRPAGGTKQRKVTINRLDVPLLLRPFSSALGKEIEERVEMQGEQPDALTAYDIFLLEERPPAHYVLAGVRHDLVDEAIDRYGRTEDKKEPAVRRKIAQWLYSPSMRQRIVRPGARYAFRALTDEGGTLHELTSFFDWGQIDGTYAYTTVGGQAVWQELSAKFTYVTAPARSTLQQIADALREVTGIERMEGQIRVHFTNYCLSCRRP